MTALQAILDGYFAGGNVPANLYVGLVKTENFTNFNDTTDTMASHPGWEEFTDYSEATRPLWTPGVVLGNANVNNPSLARFTPTVTGSANVKAIFLCDDDTVDGTTGQLYGPYFFEEGLRDTVTGVPFDVDATIYLISNTPTVN